MKLNNVYQKLATTSAQIWNSRALFIASFALTTLSAIATAYVNAMAHEAVIGREAAIGLAVLIFCIAEGTLLISNHGLLNVYTNNRQRILGDPRLLVDQSRNVAEYRDPLLLFRPDSPALLARVLEQMVNRPPCRDRANPDRPH